MRLDWRQGIMYSATIGMEGCWLYALLSLVNNKAATGISVLGLLAIYPVSFAANGLLHRLSWRPAFSNSLSWLAWTVIMLFSIKVQAFGGTPWSDSAWLLSVPRALAVMFTSFRPALLILLGSAALWWLGWRLSYLSGNFVALVSEFQFGLVMLILVFLIGSALEVQAAHSVITALVFFSFALVGISVGHALEGTGWLSGVYRSHWSVLLLLSIALILLVGFAITVAVTPDVLNLILAAIRWVWDHVMAFIAWLVSLLPEPEPGELLPPSGGMPSVGEGNENFQLFTLSDRARQILRVVWTVMMSGLILFTLWRISSQISAWLRRRLAGMGDAEFEHVPVGFWASLLTLLKYLFTRLITLRFWLGRKTRALLPEIASVRHLYRQLLRWAESRGYPRQASQTPQEFLYVLAEALPQAQGDLEFITEKYVSTRYGQAHPTEDELHRLKESWQRLKQNHLKQPKKEN